MRQVREEVMFKTYAIKKKNKIWSRSATVLPTLRFSREFGLVFLWSCGFFWRLAGCFSFGLFQLIFACFLGLFFCRFMFCGLFFFQYLWHFCCFNVLLKAYWVCFYENLLILGLFFRIYLLDFLFNFLADFSFCWIFMPTHVGLVFRLNYLFLACFCKITWHHCDNLQNHLRIFAFACVSPSRAWRLCNKDVMPWIKLRRWGLATRSQLLWSICWCCSLSQFYLRVQPK